MEKINTMQELIDWFEGLADGSVKPFNLRLGICHQVRTLKTTMRYGLMHSYLADIDYHFKSWDEFSGDEAFPVPDPKGTYTSEDVYILTGGMWEGDYGDLRKDLCRHVAKELSKHLEG